VEEAVVEKKLVEVALAKTFAPLNVLLLASKVELAAVIVMSCEPLKAVPFILREVWRIVAVPAFPVMEPVIVPDTARRPKLAEALERFVEDAVVEKKLVEVAFPKTVAPVKVLLLARRVEEAAVMVMFPVPSKFVPLIVLAF
jgi:hypothetical protein